MLLSNRNIIVDMCTLLHRWSIGSGVQPNEDFITIKAAAVAAPVSPTSVFRLYQIDGDCAHCPMPYKGRINE